MFGAARTNVYVLTGNATPTSLVGLNTGDFAGDGFARDIPRPAGEKVRGPIMGAPLSNSRGVPSSTGCDCTGILLLDPSGQIVGANEEALRIATSPLPGTGLESLRDLCTTTITAVIEENGLPLCAWPASFHAGGLEYHCQAVPLVPSLGSTRAYTVILVHRVRTREEALARLCAEFRLTRRELETVDLLALGLTNKEIASRMGLSCNTVKAFVRSVMAKLKISTRAGIIGTLVARMG